MCTCMIRCVQYGKNNSGIIDKAKVENASDVSYSIE